MKNIFKKIKNILKTKKFWVILLLLFFIPNIINAEEGIFGYNDEDYGVRSDYPSGIFGDALYMIGTLGKTANNPTGFLSAVVVKGAATIAYGIAYAMGQLIQLLSKLLAWVVDISQFTKLGVVQQGWKICRDFANLFFIAVLIYIAFSLILRLQKGDPKKLLFKVIAMAIIINFSLMIGGIIIDFSQVLFRYFIFAPLNAGEKNGVEFSKNLANSLKLQTFWASDTQSGNLKEAGAEAKTDIFQVLIKLLFVIVFSCLVLIIFGALVFTLFIRNFWLWILLILAPLAWFLGMVPIPILSKYASHWWSNFLKWAFMAPIMGFFIFLAINLLVADNTKGLIDKDTLKAKTGGDTAIFKYSNGSSSIFDPTNVMQLMVVLGFLIAGLMAGQSLGSGAAKGAMGMITKAQKGTQKWLGKRAANNFVTRGATNLGARSLNALTAVPVVGKAFKGAAVRATEKRDELRKEKGQLGKKFDSGQLTSMWGNLNTQERVEAAKKIGYDKLNQKQFEDMQKIYGKKGMGFDKEKKDMEKAAPHFTDGFKKESEEFVKSRQEFAKENTEYERVDNEYKEAVKKRDNDKNDYKKAEDNAKVLEGAGATEEAIEEAKRTINDAKNKLGASEANVSTLETQRGGAQKTREDARNEFEKARVPIMERFQETDLSKLSELTGSLGNLKTAQAQALIDVMAHKPMKSINSALSKIRGKDMAATFTLRQGVTTSMAENLYLDGGVGAVAKMSQLDSSPGAKAGHYGFAETIKRMKVDGKDIAEETVGKIMDAAHKKKQTEELLSDLAEKMEKPDDAKKEEKKEEKTEDKKS
ncbi:MAG TPA: hypothetical protein PLQ44_02350 [Candidatus Paceibacterota bacterium]|nr:hypothetical protein [Candidatus Paceibacterota bacterium]HPT40420.1 hypothetical protein [Candidatus Paceibacterota bacterium]